MKKIYKNSIVPQELEEYFTLNSTKDWEAFKNECHTGYKEVVLEIKKNQGGLCCYCEINFHDTRGIRDDFRVEHFHPKSDTDNPHLNWNLIWTNLFGCCLGGSDRTVLGTTRFIPNQKHRHSDILKAEKNWDDEILNPLEIPAFPPIFATDLNGEMKVLEENCKHYGIDIIKANNCLDSSKLNLNSPVLKGWREEVINQLRDKVNEIFDLVDDYEEAIVMVASAYLTKDENGNYSAFFSTIRSYFGIDAENILKRNHYDG